MPFAMADFDVCATILTIKYPDRRRRKHLPGFSTTAFCFASRPGSG